MDYAKDGRGRVITASQAAAGIYYRCPVCRAEVFLRSGKHYEAHFAHRANKARPECELFHPSDYIGGPTAPSRFDNDPNAAPIPPLTLSIELDPVAEMRLRGPRNWKLAITVPKAPDAHGMVRIDCGGGQSRLISLTKLALGPKIYPADCDAEDFGATWTSPEIHPRFKAAVEYRIPGLRKNVANAFADERQTLKPSVNTLAWAHNYYLIWSASLAIEIPPSIVGGSLATQGGWHCAFITLPEEEDEITRRWIEEACDLAVARPRRRWAIIYPPTLGVDSLGHVGVLSTNRLLLATFSPGDEDDADFVCTVGRFSQREKSAPGIQYFDVRHDARPDASVSVSWGVTPIAMIGQASSLTDVQEPGVELVVRSRNGADKNRSFLHCSSAQGLLQSVRRAEFDLSAIVLPNGCHGMLQTRASPTDDWQNLPLVADIAAAGTIGTELLHELNRRLQNQTLDVVFDFGPLGACFLFGSGYTGSKRHTNLSVTLRQRILWFCIAAHAYPRRAGSLQAIDDDALISHFKGVPTPHALVAHRRHLDALVGSAL
jgi:hypothetical protein